MDETLEQAIAKTVNAWYAGRPVDVGPVLNALVNVIAAISVKAGCTTPQRRRVLGNHMKNNVVAAVEAEIIRLAGCARIDGGFGTREPDR
jgi:hypothetical protein